MTQLLGTSSKLRLLKFSLLVAVGLTLHACISNNQHPYKKPYAYTDGLNSYFQRIKEGKDHISNYKYFFLIPFKSCTPCLETTLNFILKYQQTENIGVVAISYPETPKLDSLYQELQASDVLLYHDTTSLIYRYETNAFGISLILPQENPIIEIKLTDAIWITLADDLGWSLSD